MQTRRSPAMEAPPPPVGEELGHTVGSPAIEAPPPPIGGEPLLSVREGTAERQRFSLKTYVASWRSTRNLSRRASLTSLASGLDYVAGITVQFVINPLLVRGLGTFVYGAWRVLYSLN